MGRLLAGYAVIGTYTQNMPPEAALPTFVLLWTGVPFNNAQCAARKAITAGHQRIGPGRVNQFV